MKQPGQIVTFHFPQTDLAAGKVRPALLLAQAPGPFDDWLVCMISTELRHAVPGFDELVRQTDPDFAPSGLRHPSLIRLARLSVVSGQMLIGSLGAIAPERLNRIRQKLTGWINPQD